MSLVNAKARFGLEGDKLYDYLAGRYVKLTGGLMIEDEGGVWDAIQVASLIRAGKSIESAFTKRTPVVTATDQANADFVKTVDDANAKRAADMIATAEPHIGPNLLTAAFEESTAAPSPDSPAQTETIGDPPVVS